VAVLQLTNLATLKTRLALKSNASDGALRQLLRTVSGHLARKVNRSGALDLATRTEVYDVDPEQTRFRLRAAPFVSLTSAIYSPTQDFAGASPIDSTSYVVDARANALVMHHNLVQPYSGMQPQSLQLIYSAGLADLTELRASDEFAALEEAAILMIQQVLKRRRTTPGKLSMSGQGGNVNMEALSQAPLIRDILKPMRRSNLGG